MSDCHFLIFQTNFSSTIWILALLADQTIRGKHDEKYRHLCDDEVTDGSVSQYGDAITSSTHSRSKR